MCKKGNADFMRFTKCYFMEITLLYGICSDIIKAI